VHTLFLEFSYVKTELCRSKGRASCPPLAGVSCLAAEMLGRQDAAIVVGVALSPWAFGIAVAIHGSPARLYGGRLGPSSQREVLAKVLRSSLSAFSPSRIAVMGRGTLSLETVVRKIADERCTPLHDVFVEEIGQLVSARSTATVSVGRALLARHPALRGHLGRRGAVPPSDAVVPRHWELPLMAFGAALVAAERR
jgi:hypothetical protein